ncbi:MAG: hypothetical protein KC431_11025, partial [Myxococcales bacterium]|nr:hypothetical protein [Myxococcales bacterium]
MASHLFASDRRPRSPWLALALLPALALTACPVDHLGSDDEFGNPPDGDTFDPDIGDGGGSSTGTGGTDTADTTDT